MEHPTPPQPTPYDMIKRKREGGTSPPQPTYIHL